jgi:hypothetical protein
MIITGWRQAVLANHLLWVTEVTTSQLAVGFALWDGIARPGELLDRHISSRGIKMRYGCNFRR